MNELILQVAELVNEIKKQPDPYFEDLSKALNIYNALRNFESDFSSLSNKYSNSEKRYNLIHELTKDLSNKGEEYIKFAPLLIESLHEFGGSRQCKDVLPDVIRRASKLNLLSSDDASINNSETEFNGYTRIRFMRNSLKETGYIAPSKSHGLWELSDKGKQWYERWSQAK